MKILLNWLTQHRLCVKNHRVLVWRSYCVCPNMGCWHAKCERVKLESFANKYCLFVCVCPPCSSIFMLNGFFAQRWTADAMLPKMGTRFDSCRLLRRLNQAINRHINLGLTYLASSKSTIKCDTQRRSKRKTNMDPIDRYMHHTICTMQPCTWTTTTTTTNCEEKEFYATERYCSTKNWKTIEKGIAR